jgi:hypothetical protein
MGVHDVPDYGFVKCTIGSDPVLQPSRRKNEIQYHLHAQLVVADSAGNAQQWDSATDVGTSDADDLLKYRIAMNYRHAIVTTLKAATPGFTNLSGTTVLPALDFLRTDVLAATGPWRLSGVMDGTTAPEPTDGSLGIHDVHMNQGSQSNGGHNLENSIWEDGAVVIDFGQPECAAYFTAFTQQLVPTNEQGDPTAGNHPMTDADPGSLAPK